MRHEEKRKDRPAMAIVLCFCLVALVSLMVVKANIDKVRNNMEGANVAEVVQEKAADEVSEEVSDTAADVVDSRDGQDGSASDSETNEAPQFIIPVEGEIIMEHSMDQLVYWETLDQYMTHSGIDISAPKDTSVKACSGGTVTRIEEDDKFGIIAEITHGNGLVSIYGNLSAEGLAEIGDVVECGDVIGKIGHTSMFEFEGPSHVHFEMKLNGESVDPGDYV